MKPRTFNLDFETFCKADLKKVGTSVYSRDPSCEVLMAAYGYDDEEGVEQWSPAEYQRLPAKLEDALLDDRIIKRAWNAPFEMSIVRNVMRLPITYSAWRDTMVNALTCSFPGALSKVGTILGLGEDEQKKKTGTSLIRTFCVPRTPSKFKPWRRTEWFHEPEKWDEFLAYNRNDVVAERAIFKKLEPYDLPPHEWSLWFLDQEINQNGIPINMNVVRNAIDLIEHVTTDRMEKMRQITHLNNPNSGAQLLPWLNAHGYVFTDLKKGHIDRARESLTELDDPEYRKVLDMRTEVSKASVKKYHALDRAVDKDGVLRNSLQFSAAGRTWRWGGRIYQPQNLARPERYLENQLVEAVHDLEHMDPFTLEQVYMWPMDLLSSCVRPVVQAPDGYVLIDADLNAIENRVLGYMAEDQKILDVFRNKMDPYLAFGVYMFGMTYEELLHEYKVLKLSRRRTESKPAVLGCGYQLGKGKQWENEQTGEMEADGLLGYAWNMGIKLTPEQSEASVKVWRETFSDAVAYWSTIERAAMVCVRTKKRTEAGPVSFSIDGEFLKMRLPSGRHLHYWKPLILEKMTPWGKVKKTLSYMGLGLNDQWVRTYTHGGKLTENGDQAISRDLIATALMRGKRRGLDIRLHVHDQVIALAKEDKAEEQLKILIECLTEVPPWAGNSLPLDAAGHISKVFLKDA